MTIERVETFVAEAALDTPFYFSQSRFETRQVCLVKVTASDGSYGWGESYAPAVVARASIDWLADTVIGENPLHIETVWSKLRRKIGVFGRSGVLVGAMSAIDIALWDLRGKLLGQPVSALLGGQRRDKVKVYATGLYFTDSDSLAHDLADEAAGYVAQGFQAMKMKIGLGIETDLRLVRAVHAAIEGRAELMVDANCAYSLNEALRLAKLLEPFDIGWFEEPLSPEDYAGYRELRGRTTIPIASGENEYLVTGFRHLLENRCVDIAQPDICGAGGLTECKRIADMAAAFQINFTPHSWGTGVAFAAGLHLASTLDVLPGRMRQPEPLLEYDRSENPLREELTAPQFVQKDGYVALPNAPGLGVDVDMDALAQRLV